MKIKEIFIKFKDYLDRYLQFLFDLVLFISILIILINFKAQFYQLRTDKTVFVIGADAISTSFFSKIAGSLVIGFSILSIVIIILKYGFIRYRFILYYIQLGFATIILYFSIFLTIVLAKKEYKLTGLKLTLVAAIIIFTISFLPLALKRNGKYLAENSVSKE